MSIQEIHRLAANYAQIGVRPTSRQAGQVMTSANIADTVHISDAGKARAASQEQPIPAAEIMDKVVDYMGSQPTKYQILAGIRTGTF